MLLTFENGQMIPEVTLPPEESLSDFLLTFRFFYLEKESTFFPKILGILGKHSSDSDLRQALKLIKHNWENSLFRDTIQINLKGKPITSSVILDLWFNAHYFHSDEEKRKAFEDLRNSYGADFVKYMLIDSVVGSAHPIFFVHEAIRETVAKNASA